MLALGSPSAPVAWPAAAARLCAQPAGLGQPVFMEPRLQPCVRSFPRALWRQAVHLVWKAAHDIPVCALSQEGPRLVLESTLKCRFLRGEQLHLLGIPTGIRMKLAGVLKLLKKLDLK